MYNLVLLTSCHGHSLANWITRAQEINMTNVIKCRYLYKHCQLKLKRGESKNKIVNTREDN